jgi:hypothetical protein
VNAKEDSLAFDEFPTPTRNVVVVVAAATFVRRRVCAALDDCCAIASSWRVVFHPPLPKSRSISPTAVK